MWCFITNFYVLYSPMFALCVSELLCMIHWNILDDVTCVLKGVVMFFLRRQFYVLSAQTNERCIVNLSWNAGEAAQALANCSFAAVMGDKLTNQRLLSLTNQGAIWQLEKLVYLSSLGRPIVCRSYHLLWLPGLSFWEF